MSFTDVSNGIADFLAKSSLSILNLIFSLIIELINLILSPLVAIFDFFVPNLGELIEQFSDFVLFFATIPLEFFISLIPPLTSRMILLYITLKISYYTLIYGYRAIVVVPNLIRRVKFW